MKVRDIMTKEVRSCGLDTSLAAATELMWNSDCGVLPVMDDGKLAGIITDRDICIALGTRNRPASEVAVREVATRDVQACEPDASLEVAMTTMRRAKVRRLPVMREGKLEGILALNDIVEAVGKKRADLDRDEVIDTLKAVGQHRGGKAEAAAVATTWPPIPVAVA